MKYVFNKSAIIFLFVVFSTALLSGCLVEEEKLETEVRLKPTSGQPVVPEKIQTQIRGNDEVKSIQSVLNNLGYDAGPADGIMGSKTREAIKLYQQDHDLPVTGQLNSNSKKILIGE
ncbi:MAG: peptidoglycan-binding domain-containing protein [Gammaproteobacteria bacterium]|nr:peptidoglycan-binding domain-containing protein [Gammaproteobacteria bacterium]MDX2487436.1 peptidoglycan-binding domain-containing protein [Gammaproteobacteria bacterium]